LAAARFGIARERVSSLDEAGSARHCRMVEALVIPVRCLTERLSILFAQASAPGRSMPEAQGSMWAMASVTGCGSRCA